MAIWWIHRQQENLSGDVAAESRSNGKLEMPKVTYFASYGGALVR